MWISGLKGLRIKASGDQNGCQATEHCDCFHQLGLPYLHILSPLYMKLQ